MTVPTILRLKIDPFRDLKMVDWQPSTGLNLILGGGDVGKTTILDAVTLLLSPVNPANLQDTDYYGRVIEAGFSIEAVLSLPTALQHCFAERRAYTHGQSWPIAEYQVRRGECRKAGRP